MLRLQPGDPVILFNGALEGGEQEWPARVVRIGKRDVEVLVGAARAVDRELSWPVTLAVVPPANERMDWLVEKAAELGATAIQPLRGERSVLRLEGARAEAKVRHWQAIAIAASEQCGRARVMRVAPSVELAQWLTAAPASQRYLISPGAALVASAQPLPPPGAPIYVLSGPEGGLSADEEGAAVAHGFLAIRLGPRVLRAETAPLALLAWLGLSSPGR